MSRNRNRAALRAAFGEHGDAMRAAGWGTISLGPRTEAMIRRFMVKLGKALYYRHSSTVFEGVIYALHINALAKDSTPEPFKNILRMAPSIPTVKRGNATLHDQFIYRFNHSTEHGVLYAVVRFSEQFIFQLIVIGWDMANRLEAMAREAGMSLPDVGRCEFHLERKPSGAVVSLTPTDAATT